MKILQESNKYYTNHISFILSETGMRDSKGNKEYCVQTKDYSNGSVYNSFYTCDRSGAMDEFENRILKAGKRVA